MKKTIMAPGDPEIIKSRKRKIGIPVTNEFLQMLEELSD